MLDFEITPQELKTKLDQGEDVFILDVRGEDEFDIVNLNGYVIPLSELEQRLNELDKKRHIIVHCHHGVRSAKATQFLRENGFSHVQSLAGGIDQWAEEIDPKMKRY